MGEFEDVGGAVDEETVEEEEEVEDEVKEREEEEREVVTFNTLKKLQDYARQRFEVSDLIRKLERITPIDYWEKYNEAEEQVRSFSHWCEQDWRYIHEKRKEKLQELKNLLDLAPDLFEAFKEMDEMEYQHWIDYSARMEVILNILWARSAVCYNAYDDEHKKTEGVDEATKKALIENFDGLVNLSEKLGIREEMMRRVVERGQDLVSEDRKVEVERELARTREIEKSNMSFIRGNRNEKGEVSWENMRVGVGGRYTIYEWEKTTKKQTNIRIRREKYGSRWRRYLYEIDENGNKILSKDENEDKKGETEPESEKEVQNEPTGESEIKNDDKKEMKGESGKSKMKEESEDKNVDTENTDENNDKGIIEPEIDYRNLPSR